MTSLAGHFDALARVIREAGLERDGDSYERISEGHTLALVRVESGRGVVYEVGPLVGDFDTFLRWVRAQAGWYDPNPPSIETVDRVTVNGQPVRLAGQVVRVKPLKAQGGEG